MSIQMRPLRHNFVIYPTPKILRLQGRPPNPKILRFACCKSPSLVGASLHGCSRSSRMDAQGPNRPIHLPTHCIVQSLHHSIILVGSRVRELATGAHNICDGYYLCSKWHENSMGGVASTMDVCTSMSHNLWCPLGVKQLHHGPIWHCSLYNNCHTTINHMHPTQFKHI